MSRAGFSPRLPDLRAYDRGEWVLLEPLTYTSKAGKRYTAPRWFITDLASIPWLVEPIFENEHRPAGVMHDWLYCSQQCGKAEADALFAEMLEVLGASRAEAWLAKAGLWVGGGAAWDYCVGGPHARDFAWEFMSSHERPRYAALLPALA